MFILNLAEWKAGRTTPHYVRFKFDVLYREFPHLTVIDVYETTFDEKRFNILPFVGHASPYGTKVIAEHVAAELSELTATLDSLPPRWCTPSPDS